MSKKYLVATVEGRVKNIAKLKARLAGMSIDDLVTQAISEYEGEPNTICCPHCLEKTGRKRVSKRVSRVVAGKSYSIEIKNYPKDVCHICKSEYDDVDVSVYTDNLMQAEFLRCLRKGKPIPVKVDFNDLVSIDKHIN